MKKNLLLVIVLAAIAVTDLAIFMAPFVKARIAQHTVNRALRVERTTLVPRIKEIYHRDVAMGPDYVEDFCRQPVEENGFIFKCSIWSHWVGDRSNGSNTGTAYQVVTVLLFSKGKGAPEPLGEDDFVIKEKKESLFSYDNAPDGVRDNPNPRDEGPDYYR